MDDLKLPLNFGLEDLYENANNNAAFLLAGGERFGAASLMLGFHSPVIKEKYIKQGILEIEADEFSLAAVKAVCEAMYCGHLQITRQIFRDVNKMVQVFQITWMLPKCGQYFEEALGEAVTQDSEEDFKFLFEEAVYFSEVGKSGSLLEVWKDKTGEKRYNDFARNYLKSAADIPHFSLETLIGLTSDLSVFLESILNRIKETDSTLDNVSRFLLINIDLLECIEYHPDKIVEIFNILLENEDSPDWRMLNKMYRDVTQQFVTKQRKGKTAVSQSTVAVADVPIVNLFRDWEEVSIYKMLENVSAVSHNLYMVLEFLWCTKMQLTHSVIRKLVELRRENNWGPVHTQFVHFLDHYQRDYWGSGDSKARI